MTVSTKRPAVPSTEAQEALLTDAARRSLVVMSPDLPGFPAVQAATQTVGAIGAKGSGKTFLAHRYVEELTRCGQPFIAFDPIGNWGPSLRLGKDGKSPGLPVVVLGGDESDAPLPEGCGADLGAYLAEQDGAVVLDVSSFSKKKRKTIVADLCEALFQGAKRRRVPRLVAFEESQLFVPQGFERGEERMIGAVTDIVRLGRNYGLGALLVSQRPQSVNKEVLNQVECLFVGQLRGPQERKAIAGWVTEQGQDLRAQLAELPALSVGEFFCWSPSWLRVFKKVKISPKSTFDGTRTPDGSETRRGKISTALPPSAFLSGLRTLLAPPTSVSVPEKVSKTAAPVPTALSTALLPVPGDSMDDQRRRDLERELDGLRIRYGLLHDHARRCERWIARVQGQWQDAQLEVPNSWQEPMEEPRPMPLPGVSPLRPEPIRWNIPQDIPATAFVRTVEWAKDSPAKQAPSEGDKGTSESYGIVLLGAIAAYGPLTRVEITLLTGRSRASTAFISAMNWLLDESLIVTEGPAFLATSAGKKRSHGAPMSRGRTVFEFWQKKWNAYDALLFRTLWPYSQGLTRAELSEKSGRSSASTAFIASVNRLFKFGVTDGGGNGQKIVVNATARKWMA